MRLTRASALILLGGLLLGAAGSQAAAGPSWMKLDASRGSGYAWAVKVKPGGGRVSRVSEEPGPCVLVETMWRSGPLEQHRSKYRECGSGQALSDVSPPLVAMGMQPAGDGSGKMSVVGMISGPAVRRVRITFRGGAEETIQMRPIESEQARRLGLGRFRYAAFAIRGVWCAERLVSLGAGGGVLWDSGLDSYRCGAGDPPHFLPRAGA
jgi:hypothetical protein